MLHLLPRPPRMPRRMLPVIRPRALARARTAPPASVGPSWLGAVGDVSTIAGGAFTASGVGSTVDLGGDTGDYTSILSAWGGGIVVSGGLYIGAAQTSGHFLVIFGGGHTDYFGNEVYAFGPLENDTPAYYRLRDPTNPPPLDVDEDASGYPVSRHSYDSLGYVTIGGRNWMFCAGQPFRSDDANGGGTCHAFDFDVASPNSNKPWITKAALGSIASIRTIGVDNTNGYLWAYYAGGVARYDIAANSWINGDGFKSPPGGDDGSSDVDPSRGLWFIATTTSFAMYRTNNGILNDFYTPSTTGTPPSGTHRSVVWDADDDRFVVWAGGNTLYYLTPPATNPYEGGNAWAWSSETYGGDTVGTPYTNGTFGRFGRVKTADWRGYSLWYHAASAPVFFRRA